MSKEPLLPTTTPNKKPLLCPVPEYDEICNLLPENDQILIPSKLKNRLIFGSPIEPSSSLVDSLSLSLSDTSTSNPSGKRSLRRSRSGPALAANSEPRAFSTRADSKTPHQFTSPIVRQAVLLLVLYFAYCVSIYWYNREQLVDHETHLVVDALYFCIVTMCTIGYGDLTPGDTVAKLFSIMFVVVGFGFIQIWLSGMVTYVLELQESHFMRYLDNGYQPNHPSYIIEVKKRKMKIRMKVALALGVVVLCIGGGAGVMHYIERLDWLDSFYLSVMSVSTVGYGDRAFRSMAGRIFASIWLLVSILAMARVFLYLAEARMDARQKGVMYSGKMTVSEFVSADIDNDGYVSMSEYVIYKLKEMDKISQNELLHLCENFNRLDSGNCGKITLSDLTESHHY